MPRARKLLVCGSSGSGKTALIHRFVQGDWVSDPPRTVGLDQEAGRISITMSSDEIIDELRVVLPPDGLELEMWEIGGSKGGHLRSVPRGCPIDGLLLCYDPCDRASFQNAAHLLLQHRTDRHLEHNSAAVVASILQPPRLAVVLCGLKRDEIDAKRTQTVSTEEAEKFAQANAIKRALLVSSKTGENVLDAFQILAAAILEAEEDAEAENIVAAESTHIAPTVHTWSLARSNIGSNDSAMTSPQGERPHEPHQGEPPSRLVEVVDVHGAAFSARPLNTCLERGLLHRAVHVWFCDENTGGLLLRKYAPNAPKHPCRWGPSCHGEVHCYGSTGNEQTGPHTSEISINAAVRIMREQLGVDQSPERFEHWFSCTSRTGQCYELLDVFATNADKGGLPPIHLLQTEGVEWVHFLDIFGSAAQDAQDVGNLFHIEDTYRSSMVQRMRARIVHSYEQDGSARVAFAHGRPN